MKSEELISAVHNIPVLWEKSTSAKSEDTAVVVRKTADLQKCNCSQYKQGLRCHPHIIAQGNFFIKEKSNDIPPNDLFLDALKTC